MNTLEWILGRLGTGGLTIATAAIAVVVMVGYTRGVIAHTPAPEQPLELAAGEQRVESITDGDSLRLKGIDRAIRLAGIDAPESTAVRFGHVECGGHDATDYLHHLVAGDTVIVELAEDPTDRYDRILAYIWIELDGHEVLVNEAMVRSGLAYAVEYRPNTRYSSHLLAAEHEAAAARLGIWSHCHDDLRHDN